MVTVIIIIIGLPFLENFLDIEFWLSSTKRFRLLVRSSFVWEIDLKKQFFFFQKKEVRLILN